VLRLTYRIDEDLRIGRQLLLEIRRLGMPTGSEVLDVISSQYLGDLIACGAIGARTTESQLYRELPLRRRSASRTAPKASSLTRDSAGATRSASRKLRRRRRIRRTG
jgi:hypothetical protein